MIIPLEMGDTWMSMNRWLMGVVLWGACSLCMAGNIYVCKGKHGVNVYQNTLCANAAAQLQHSTFNDDVGRPSAPEPAYERMPTGNSNNASAAVAVANHRNAPVQQSSEPVQHAYACQAGNKRWIQSTPCPATYTKSQMVDVDGYSDNGTPMSGTAFVPTQAPVQSQTLDAQQICDRLNHFASTGHGDAAAQGYERNKLRAKYNCGGPR